MNSVNAALAGIIPAAATGLAADPANAQAGLEQTGDGYSIVHERSAGRGNVAGGRTAQLLGGGDNGAVPYSGRDPVREGRSVMFSGGGDAVLSRTEPAPVPASPLATERRRRA